MTMINLIHEILGIIFLIIDILLIVDLILGL